MPDPDNTPTTNATSQVVPGIPRTLLPILVGEIVAWGAQHGIDITDATALKLITVAAGVVWWVGARLVELKTKHPKVGSAMLGSQKSPTYKPEPPKVNG